MAKIGIQSGKARARKRPPASGTTAGAGTRLQSKVTGRWQTTLPSGVRKALGLEAGAEICYEIRGDHAVIRRAEPGDEDPVVAAFLDFLESDMRARPENLVPVTHGLVARLRGLTEGVEVRRDERIEGTVAL